MANLDALLPIIRKSMSGFKAPGPHDRVFKSECMFTFDTPESRGGLYLNIVTHQAVSERFLALDRSRTTATVYLHQKWTRVAKHPTAADAIASGSGADGSAGTQQPPTKLAIGLPGGFDVDAAPFEISKEHSIVVFTGPADDADAKFVIGYPSDEAMKLPQFLLTICDALIAHEDVSAQQAASAWTEQRQVSRYALELVQLANGVTISPRPADWACSTPGCDKKENLWLNLSDGFIGCGRKNYDGTGGNGHALQHFKDTGDCFPLCAKLGTITSAGADVYSYAPDEDDMVEDPHLAKHLSHWGINILSLEKTEKTMQELELDLNVNYDFSRISESGVDLVAVSGPGFLGLDNLGNTCYMNSTIQVLTTLPELRTAFTDETVASRLYRTAATGAAGSTNTPADDLLVQTAKLFSGMHDARYAMALPANGGSLGTAAAGADAAMQVSPTHAVTVAAVVGQAEVGISSADASVLTHTTAEDKPKHGHTVMGASSSSTSAAQPPAPGPGAACGYIVPRMYRQLVGKGHPEFSTASQQDAPHFMEWLFGLYERAYTQAKSSGRAAPIEQHTASGCGGAGAGGPIPLPPLPSDLFGFQVENRLQCAQSGAVRYGSSKELFLRLPIPTEAATNGDEVEAAKAAQAAASSASAGVPSSGGTGVGSDAVGDAKRARTDPSSSAPAKQPLPKLKVPFAAAIQSFAASSTIDDWMSPATGAKGQASTSNRLASCPRYLIVVLNRYTLAADWTTVKVDADVRMPLDLDIDNLPGSAAAAAESGAVYGDGVQSLRAPAKGESGLQAGEVALPTSTSASSSSASTSNAGAAAPAVVQPDDELVATLISMGFPDAACMRAAVATNYAGPEPAMEWLITHSEDANFNDPYVPATAAPAPAAAAAAAAPAVDPAAVAQLCDMGFSEAKASKALKSTGGNIERAMDWLFSHMEEDDDAIAAGEDVAMDTGSSGAAGASSSSSAPPSADASASGKYALFGIISHMGSSTASGHYVAHIRKDTNGNPPGGAPSSAAASSSAESASKDVRWYLFNDGKVAESANPPLEAGYAYFYRRLD